MLPAQSESANWKGLDPMPSFHACPVRAKKYTHACLTWHLAFSVREKTLKFIYAPYAPVSKCGHIFLL
jgi:hypothetical protein